MRKHIPLQLIARLLLVVMLTFSFSCIHESAHAMKGSFKTTASQESVLQSDHCQHCPCAPQQDDADSDGCDDCCNCACHTIATIQTFSFDGSFSAADLNTFEPFRYLPEVFLTKFIPPQL